MYSNDCLQVCSHALFKKYSDVAIRILCKKIQQQNIGAKHVYLFSHIDLRLILPVMFDWKWGEELI